MKRESLESFFGCPFLFVSLVVLPAFFLSFFVLVSQSYLFIVLLLLFLYTFLLTAKVLGVSSCYIC